SHGVDPVLNHARFYGACVSDLRAMGNVRSLGEGERMDQIQQAVVGRVSQRMDLDWFRSAKLQKQVSIGFSLIVLSVGLVFFLFPIYWMVTASLKTLDEVFLFPPSWWPKELQWQNYREALTFMPFGRYALNTILV